MPRVSVIVPVFNGMAFLPAFFDSLRAALPAGSQVLIIDDGSTQPVVEAVPEIPESSEVVYLRNAENLGYSAAVNRGFAQVTGDVVIQLNSDLVLDPECISAMIELIASERNVGIVGSKLIYPTTGGIQHIGMAFGEHSKCHIYADLPADHPLCRVTREMQIVTGATVAMTRRVLDQLGPLDEGYFNHNDDLDHCLLAVDRGLRNFTCADSVAYHWESHSGPARFARVEAAEARFWGRWSGRYDIDLGRFVDEALDQTFGTAPDIDRFPFEVIDLSRGSDQQLVLDRLADRWPGLAARVRSFRQMNNSDSRLSLPLVLPHWFVSEPVPFIYLVDRHRELAENAMWFENRRRVVKEELIVDLRAAVLRTSEIGCVE